jgi:fatty acid desaturase
MRKVSHPWPNAPLHAEQQMESGAAVRQVMAEPSNANRRSEMLWTIALVLIALWLLGLVSAYTLGGFIHVLLVIAVIVIILQVIQGRRL